MVDFQESGHGGDLLGFAARFGKREEEILDFSSNINPLGPSETLIELYHRSAAELSRYPDAGARPFVEKIAEIYSISPEMILAGNGSMEILSLAVRALKPARALIVEPCFKEYRALLENQGCLVSAVPLNPEDNFKFPLNLLANQLSRVQLLILGHPNNPTGTALTSEEMTFLLEQARRARVFVIADEAFADWTPEISVIPEVQKGGLLVVRSLTKFFALAGIRSGFAIGLTDLIRKMKTDQGPWSCNRLAQKLSIAAMEDREFSLKTRNWFKEEAEWLRASLEGLGEFKVFPSLANFFLVKSNRPAPDLFDFLGPRGIYVKQVKDILGFEDSFFRIAVRTRGDNQRLIETLSAWIRTSAVLTPSEEALK